MKPRRRIGLLVVVSLLACGRGRTLDTAMGPTLVGTYVDGQARLELRADGGFVFSSNPDDFLCGLWEISRRDGAWRVAEGGVVLLQRDRDQEPLARLRARPAEGPAQELLFLGAPLAARILERTP